MDTPKSAKLPYNVCPLPILYYPYISTSEEGTTSNNMLVLIPNVSIIRRFHCIDNAHSLCTVVHQ